MIGRLGKKLADSRGGDAPPAEASGEKELCLVVNDGPGFCCQFHETNGRIWLLPYGRLESVEMDPEGTVLTAVYSSHEVLLKGENLWRVAEVMGRGRSLMVQTAEPSRKGDYQGDDVFISEVELTERKQEAVGRPETVEECSSASGEKQSAP